MLPFLSSVGHSFVDLLIDTHRSTLTLTHTQKASIAHKAKNYGRATSDAKS